MAQRESSLLYLSTEHATRAGKDMSVTINNSTAPTKVVQIVPVTLTIPNIFPNVNEYRNSFFIDNRPVSIPAGQYDVTSLATALTTASLTLTFTHNGAAFEMENTSGVPSTVNSPTSDIFDMLGFHELVQPPTAGFDFYYIPIANGATVVGSSPNLGGEKMVFLMSQKLAHGNLTFGADSTDYNVVAHLCFHNVDYGQTGIFEVNEASAHSIDFLHHNNLDRIELAVFDSKFRKLQLPINYHLRMVLRLYHRDSFAKQVV